MCYAVTFFKNIRQIEILGIFNVPKIDFEGVFMLRNEGFEECFLNFHGNHKELEKKLAKAVTDHAIPIGSGTVARTLMIPIEERAALAVIAWMRHQTTAYDNLKIARVKGERRAVRRSLAQQSVTLLASYREGRAASENCPLQKALNKLQLPNHD